MRLRVLVLGVELLELELSTDEDNGRDPGDATTEVVGFAPPSRDTRWWPAPGEDRL